MTLLTNKSHINSAEHPVETCNSIVEPCEIPMLIMVGLNFRTSPVAVREKLSFTPEKLAAMLNTIASHPLIPRSFRVVNMQPNRVVCHH